MLNCRREIYYYVFTKIGISFLKPAIYFWQIPGCIITIPDIIHKYFHRLYTLRLFITISHCIISPVGWDNRIYRLQLSNESPGYDIKQTNCNAPALELWGMWSTTSLLLPLGPLMLNWIVWLNWIAWNRNVFDNWTVLTFKLRAYTKLNYLKYNCFLTLKQYLH